MKRNWNDQNNVYNWVVIDKSNEYNHAFWCHQILWHLFGDKQVSKSHKIQVPNCHRHGSTFCSSVGTSFFFQEPFHFIANQFEASTRLMSGMAGRFSQTNDMAYWRGQINVRNHSFAWFGKTLSSRNVKWVPFLVKADALCLLSLLTSLRTQLEHFVAQWQMPLLTWIK